METPVTETIELSPGPPPPAPPGHEAFSLDGEWEMVGCEPGKGSEAAFLSEGPWPNPIPARIPCSVHTALLEAGRIPDPSVGKNADIAREESYKEWWFRRRFTGSGFHRPHLVFDGVDYSCTVWLNGVRLGRHEGAFGGPDFDITGLLRDENALVVRLDPVPQDWKLVLKTNVVYGWHYVNLPSLGIWRSVRIESRPFVDIEESFVSTHSLRGEVDLWVRLRGESAWTGQLEGRIVPANFEGKTYGFSLPVAADQPVRDLHLRFAVPDPQLWWPVDLGAQNLYSLALTFASEQALADTATTTFGIRTIETRPAPEGMSPARYNWQFVINGKPVFLKGANWAITDALLRFDSSRYERFLTLARDQHCQLLRSWGGGLLESDTFYDLCDRLGVMVYQEFPLTWQNFDVLSPSVIDETAVRNVKRLRNHPSLLMWGGGNEHSGVGPVIEQIGRICLELDGTRPFHRTDPYGGSLHNYDVYWGRQPLDRNLDLHAAFIGEFGLSSVPNLESVMRYLPPEEQGAWPPPDDGSFIRHTPTYNKQHMEIMEPYASEFCDTSTMQGLITGMQLAQAVGLRHTLERARSSPEEATGICYYKLTDVYPAAAWSTIDWYGVPKIAFWFIQDAYAPLHACIRLKSLSVPEGHEFRAPIHLLDDAESLQGPWKVVARALDGNLREVGRMEAEGQGPLGSRVKPLNDLVVDAAQAESAPLLIVTEVQHNDAAVDRTFYWVNHARKPGCLFSLPRTRLEVERIDGGLRIRNAGNVPAVAVHFVCPEISDRFTAEDAYFWLDPGEFRDIRTSAIDGVRVASWNADAV